MRSSSTCCSKGQDKIVNLTLGQLPNTIEAKADADEDDKGGPTKKDATCRSSA